MVALPSLKSLAVSVLLAQAGVTPFLSSEVTPAVTVARSVQQQGTLLGLDFWSIALFCLRCLLLQKSRLLVESSEPQ